jgi:hypothetical protein
VYSVDVVREATDQVPAAAVLFDSFAHVPPSMDKQPSCTMFPFSTGCGSTHLYAFEGSALDSSPRLPPS